MVEHLVWFKLKDEVTDEQKTAMLNGLRGLQGQIEGIEHLACGEDFSGRSNGYQIGLVVRFSSRQALDEYQPHPIHKAFVEEFRPLWDDVKALDFETD
jgi:hypothetical protein